MTGFNPSVTPPKAKLNQAPWEWCYLYPWFWLHKHKCLQKQQGSGQLSTRESPGNEEQQQAASQLTFQPK